MSWRTNPVTIAIRTITRKVGINKLIGGWFLRSKSYEDVFQDQTLSSIQEGDCVWDIGANVGLYTKQFSELVGNTGKVFAFEPSPTNQIRLKEAIQGYGNTYLIQKALGAQEGKVLFSQGVDALGATSKIIDNPYRQSTNESNVEIDIVTGDTLVKSSQICKPNVLKIDTEGYELDVLHGLRATIQESTVRTICIEVHFQLLCERNQRNAPQEIEELLKSNGFKFSWPDSSHIIANRDHVCNKLRGDI